VSQASAQPAQQGRPGWLSPMWCSAAKFPCSAKLALLTGTPLVALVAAATGLPRRQGGLQGVC